MDNNGKPVSDASVILLQSRFATATKKAKQVLLKGINTSGNGEFNFEDLPVMAKLTLQITSAGFATYEHGAK